MALRAGIVGFGGMGQRHYQAYQGTPCEVVAICEWQPERVLKVVPGFPADHIYKDVHEMFAREQLDIVSVASNGPTHAPITIAAAEAGVRAILCEKPSGTTLAEAEAVRDAAVRTGARIAVNHIRRWSPGYLALRARLQAGEFGALRHITYSSGSTGLGNFGVHAFDLMRFLSGAEPVWVVGALDRTGTPNPRGAEYVDPAGFGMIMFSNGMRGFVDSGEDTGVNYMFTLVTEQARITIDELSTRWTVRLRSEEARRAPFTRYGMPMEDLPCVSLPHDIVAQTRSAIVELAGDGPLSSPPADGIRALELVMAFHESDARGQSRVDLPLTGDARGRRVPIA
ncbi:MAG: Gfo/Idh/MocA family oxidoreductase [Acidimicrobiia bacterium]|nr:Gfo/Idh/MocA family oxidoreductase [Acidimicrobiia bacterium]